MNIIVTPKALDWFKKELDLQAGDAVRFFARYGGCSTVQKGFSLGLAKEDPVEPAAQTTVDGITFFVEDQDRWYFDDHDLTVDVNEETDEPMFIIQ
jgi:uncharacterized protein YneR